MNPKKRLRRVLLLSGILPAVLALVFAVLVLRMLSSHGAGEDSFDGEDFAEAAASFDSAGGINPFEDWITAFDRGASRHADGEFEDAIDLYRSALKTVPQEDECTVRINLALVYEAIGDELVEPEDADSQARTDAIEAWEEGLTALRDGDCPEDSGRGEDQTEDAAAVEERLEKKIEEQKQQQQQQQQQGNKGDKKKSEDEKKQDEQERKERELEKRNQRGEKDRERYERQRESGGYQPEW